MFPIISEGVAVYAYKVVNERYHFLQLRRSGYDDAYGRSWQPVYGGSLDGETPVQVALRELHEETGLEPLQMILVEHIETFFFRPKNAILMLPVFAAEVDPNSVIELNEEHEAYRWVEEKDLNFKFIWRSQRQALAIILESLREFPQNIPLSVV